MAQHRSHRIYYGNTDKYSIYQLQFYKRAVVVINYANFLGVVISYLKVSASKVEL